MRGGGSGGGGGGGGGWVGGGWGRKVNGKQRLSLEKAQFWITGDGAEQGVVGVPSEFHVAATNRADNQVCVLYFFFWGGMDIHLNFFGVARMHCGSFHI